jgi:hypothetical protein
MDLNTADFYGLYENEYCIKKAPTTKSYVVALKIKAYRTRSFLFVQGGSQSRQMAKLFLQSSELGLSHPLTYRRVGPPPFGSGGGGHTRLRKRGWGSPNSDEGTYPVVPVLCINRVSTLWG